MNRAIALVVVPLMLIAGGVGCSNVTTHPPETHPSGNTAVEETPAVSATRLTSIISEIMDHPDQFIDQQVEVIGYFRGWDLLGEAKGAPPVTRSDWVVADSSGAIYVTGTGPEGLDPSSKEATTKIIHLVAIVQQNQNGVYLQAISVELVSTE